MKNKHCIWGLICLALLPIALGAAPAGTAFTYQGRLNNSAPANGTVPVTFSLWDAPNSGNNVGVPALLSTSATVSNWVYSVDLDFGATAFLGEARWLQIQINGIVQPKRTRIAPTPYAINASSVPNGAIRSSHLATVGAPSSGQVLSYNGASLAWTTPSSSSFTIPYAGTASSANSAFQINNLGGAGNSHGIVGTTASSVSQVAGVRGEATSSSGVVIGVAGTAVNSPAGTGIVGVGAATGGYFSSTTVGGNAAVFDQGNVGIGTLTPPSKLTIAGAQDALTIAGWEPFMTFYDGNSAQRSTIQSAHGDLVLRPDSGFVYLANTHDLMLGGFPGRRGSPGRALVDGGNELYLNYGNDWTTTRIGGADITLQSENGFVHLANTHDLTLGGYPGRRGSPGRALVDGGNELHLNYDSDWATTIIGGATTIFGGSASVSTLTIRGGADLAEPFPMKEDGIEKGSVVVIDDEHPGRLKCSTAAYDTRVAGIVSGANGINPGIALKQEGKLDQGENIALTGRVYVRTDASFGAIKPGDLLTTSDTPGHAMKVSDLARAQGAILGKAMTTLAEGKGLVLVLVTLQ